MMVERKPLSLARSVEAARILFELNTEPAQIVRMASEAGLPHCADREAELQLCLQWYGFVHAAVAAALMVHAPNVVLAEYLRGTTAMLGAKGLTPEQSAAFVDSIFSPYMELLAKEKQRDCPLLFFRALCRAEKLEDVPPRTAAIVSGVMAMTLSALADKLERYDMRSE